eukprot:7286547-Alexandrium_andersonii.AAC.1
MVALRACLILLRPLGSFGGSGTLGAALHSSGQPRQDPANSRDVQWNPGELWQALGSLTQLCAAPDSPTEIR